MTAVVSKTRNIKVFSPSNVMMLIYALHCNSRHPGVAYSDLHIIPFCVYLTGAEVVGVSSVDEVI